MKKFSIVLLQYNMAEMTHTCIDSILRLHGGECEIVLVDNFSTEQISNEYKNKVKYIRSDRNIYFSGGMNLGVKNCSNEIICLLNNDIILNAPINNLIDFFEANSVGILGTKLLYSDRSIQHAGCQVLLPADGNIGFNHRYMGCPENHPPANVIREYQAITGAFMLVNKEDFNKINGFSEDYIMGFEDNDLCLKMKFELGKKIIYHPGADITHLWNKTPRTVFLNSFYENNYRLFSERWKNKLIPDSAMFDQMDEELLKSNR